MKQSTSHIVTATLAAVGGAAVIFTLVHSGVLGTHGANHQTSAGSAQEVTKAAKIMYNCPMHPQIIRDEPGTCPICGMTLVPMKDHDNENGAPSDAIRIEASMIQSIGVSTVAVAESELVKSIHVNGNIAIDPQKIAVVNARSMGWIESIPQGNEGTNVYAGQKLASFYSPDLVAAQEDFLQAIRTRDESLVASARKRLEVLGIPVMIIDSIQKSKTSIRTLPIQAPISGVVLARSIVQGQNVMPGFDLYRIADLSHVWVVGKAYPEDVAKLRTGMNVQVFLQGLESMPRDGKLIFVAPIVDQETKTTEIRVDIKNTPELSYKPGMNADLRIQTSLGTGIAIPAQSVIRTGERTVAIVSLGKGYFAPRDLTLGEKLGDSVQVLEGLNTGDSLVTSAQFLIDSESNLKKAVQSFGNKEEPMLATIIDGSIRNRYLVILGTILVIGIGIFSILNTKIDAIPDLSDVQVIVYTENKGQSPRIIEDQVTYPLTTTLVSVPGSKTVRGYSFFGYSLVYIIFEDGTDLYWARSRVLETLNAAQKRLPAGVIPTLGPDATGVGWIYEYAIVSDKHSLQELRSLQDWFLKYELASVPGVSEVASIGGFVKQYQVTVNPERLRNYGIRLDEVESAVQKSNGDEGGEAIEIGEAEFMIRGVGYLKSVQDLENVPIRKGGFKAPQAWAARWAAWFHGPAPVASDGPTIYLRDIASVTIGPEMRRGIAELNGTGEVAGGIVVMRSGENALKVIEGVKKKLESIQSGLPAGVQIVPTYDRSGLIERAVDTLKDKLIEEILIVALVCLIFLLHARSALVAVFVLPTSILMAFIVMRQQGLNANIMSLGGIAIAIGAMVDAAIIMIENAHKHIEAEREKPLSEQKPHWTVIAEASKEVGPALFFSLLVITISFVPVFTLGEQEGRMFRPLAFTKTYSMAAASILAITIVPVLMGFFVRGKILPEHRNPINRWLERLYHPIMHATLRHPRRVIAIALMTLLVTIIPFRLLGSEFMPPLKEGDLLYMPTTMPGISVGKARELLQQTDKLIKTVPEVERVFGKAGRAETATDPAGLDMFETVIQLKPEKEWRKGVDLDSIIRELDTRVKVPGLTNSWTMPIKTRIDMLSTGIKTPIGIKISGPNLDSLEDIGKRLESIVREVPGTTSAFAERAVGGNYLEVRMNRVEAGRYGISVEDIRSVIRTALGGMPVTTTVEGLERYSVNLRYPRELRDSPEKIGQVLLDLPTGGQIPLSRVADLVLAKGPMVIRSENTRPNSWVFVDIRDSDIGGYVKRAKEAISANLTLPPGYTLIWSGQFEYLERMHKRMAVVIPLTLLIILLILFINTGSIVKTAIVFMAVPFSLVGAIWILYFLGYNMSLAVWVGIIALAGLDAETGVVMLLYLEQAYNKAKEAVEMVTLEQLHAAIDHGAVRRVRPKIMTASVILAGLFPILWSTGAGADVMKRIAAPMVGGVVTSVLMELAVYPAIYLLWKRRSLGKENEEISNGVTN